MARILICDDEEGIRESFKLILGDAHQLTFACNSSEALSILNTEDDFQLMLLDIKMPKMNGLELLKKVKVLKPRLPVVIVTGYQSSETAQEASKNGASGYIAKPFESQEIIQMVAKLAK